MCPYSLPNERKCWVWLRSSWMARGEKLADVCSCVSLSCACSSYQLLKVLDHSGCTCIFTGPQNRANEESSCAGSGSHRGSGESGSHRGSTWIGSHRGALECCQSQVALIGLYLNCNVEKETELCGNRFHLSFRCTKLLTLFIWAGNWQPAEKLRNLIPFPFLGGVGWGLGQESTNLLTHTQTFQYCLITLGWAMGIVGQRRTRSVDYSWEQTAAKTTSPLCHSLCHCKLVDWQ